MTCTRTCIIVQGHGVCSSKIQQTVGAGNVDEGGGCARPAGWCLLPGMWEGLRGFPGECDAHAGWSHLQTLRNGWLRDKFEYHEGVGYAQDYWKLGSRGFFGGKTLLEPLGISIPLLCISGSLTFKCIREGCLNSTASLRQLCDNCDVNVEWECGQGHHHKAYFPQCVICRGKLMACTNLLPRSNGSAAETGSIRTKETVGSVKEDFAFIVKEDLSIMASSTIETICLLKSLRLKRLDDLEYKEFHIGGKERLLIFRAAMMSDTPIRDTFQPLWK